MTGQLFRAILSGSLLVYIIYFIYIAKKIRKGENITWYIKRGFNCYGCKSKIEENLTMEMVTKEDEELTLCKVCKREEQLSSLLNKKILKFNLFKINKFCYRAKKFPIFLNLFAFLIFILDIFIDYYVDGTRFFFYVYYILMVFVWILNTYSLKISYVKKENPL